ncbi:hypothetical protein, partial [Enterobacter bugandensis]|uniref:hypothetical protein n=1 Tax=Enterobacter bugandensis TaxID=881260 RepID=UPI00195471D3
CTWSSIALAMGSGLATKLVGKALVVMQRQLYAQSSPGAFDALKDEYFLAITKNSAEPAARVSD